MFLNFTADEKRVIAAALSEYAFTHQTYADRAKKRKANVTAEAEHKCAHAAAVLIDVFTDEKIRSGYHV